MQTATRLTEFHVLACAMAEIVNGRKICDYFSYWDQCIDARVPRLNADSDNCHADNEALHAAMSVQDANGGGQDDVCIRLGTSLAR